MTSTWSTSSRSRRPTSMPSSPSCASGRAAHGGGRRLVRAVRGGARSRRRRRRADGVVVRRLRRMEPHPARPDVRSPVRPVRGRAPRLRRGGTRRFYPATVVEGAPTDDHGPALRRWEMFSLAPDAPRAARERLVRAMRDCGRFIPGISRCAVGTNTAGPPIELVWETTYQSVGAYATTYMTHPYHASLLDRFLLPDCPERITTTNPLGAGLIGYPVGRDRPLGPVAVRRLLLLDFDDATAAAVVARAVDAAHDGWSDSILAENTMATAGSTARPTSASGPRGRTSGTSASPRPVSTRSIVEAGAGRRRSSGRSAPGRPRSSTNPDRPDRSGAAGIAVPIPRFPVRTSVRSANGFGTMERSGGHEHDPDPGRSRAQPPQRRPRAAARQADRVHRALRLGQVVARVRHHLRRGPASVRRVVVGLRPPVPGPDGQARRRLHRGPVACDLDRPEVGVPEPAVDGRHHHRDLRLPAPALRAHRHSALSQLRPGHHPPDAPADRGPRAPARGGHALPGAGAGRAGPEGRVRGPAEGAGVAGLHPGPARR